MSESGNKRRPPRTLWLPAVIALPILYVFSIGPLHGLANCGVIPLEVNWDLESTIYFSICWLRVMSKTAETVFTWYSSFFWL